MVKFDVAVHVPKESRVLAFAVKVEPPESFTIDYTGWDPSFRSIMGKNAAGGLGGPSDARVYEVMALRAFDQLSTKLKGVFFDAATANRKLAPPTLPSKPPARPADDDGDM
jgi:hypothetical protein